MSKSLHLITKRFKFDPTCDGGYINFPSQDKKVASTEQLNTCILVDKNSEGEIIGVELLGVKGLLQKPTEVRASLPAHRARK